MLFRSQIETWMNNSEYVTQDWVNDELQSSVENAVEEAIEDADIEEKVRDLFNDASPAPMSEEAIKEEIQKSLAEVISKIYDTLKRK